MAIEENSDWIEFNRAGYNLPHFAGEKGLKQFWLHAYTAKLRSCQKVFLFAIVLKSFESNGVKLFAM